MHTIDGLSAFPCCWPVGWSRTAAKNRRSSLYRISFARSRDHILRELRLLGAEQVVVSTNLPLRRDQLPYANQAEPDDPAVAVYWVESNKTTRVVACDCWNTVRENMRAVSKAINCLRQLENTGTTQVMQRAFLGLAALPANTPHYRGWREVFGYMIDWTPDALTAEAIERRYRELILKAHPDTGGSNEALIELNKARRLALDEVINAGHLQTC